MARLSHINDGGLRRALGNQCLSFGTLAINAGGAATIKTTGATTYRHNGLNLTKAALSAQSFAVTHRADGTAVTTDEPAYVQPQNTSVVYVVALDATGTVAIVQGTYAGQAVTFKPDLSRIETGTGFVPYEPAGYVAIGAVKVVTAATTFTPGTTALDAANITFTFHNVGLLPDTL